MTRSLFFVCVAALACMVSAAPKTSDVASTQTASSVAPTTSIMSGGGYDTHGLPSSIFPNYSGIAYVDTDELDDGEQYLEDQNDGKLPE